MKPACKTIGCALALGLLFLAPGCSVKRMAVNQIGNALASGGSTFSSDNDPELVRQAIPFSLKLMESLLAESPEHKGLLLATASGFTQYGYAFVQLESVRLKEEDYFQSVDMQERAKKLYLRARDYGLRGLEAAHSGFTNTLASSPQQAVMEARTKDVPLLYWTAAAWAAAISINKTDAFLMADLPKIDALIDRALELDESFDDGAIHNLLISYEMIRSGQEGVPEERAEHHFERSLELSNGQLASPYVAYAESVCIPLNRREAFLDNLDKALSIDPESRPEARLINLIMQEHARWLADHVDDFFLPPLEDEP